MTSAARGSTRPRGWPRPRRAACAGSTPSDCCGAAATRTCCACPGIYARDRLPLARLQQKLPALAPDDDVYTSHIHADDLARIAIVALLRGQPCRVTNTVDDGGLKMGEYFDLVADRFGLERPPRLPRDELKRAVSPMMYSFMSASRRIRNARLKRELRVRLVFPTVRDALAKIPAPSR